MCRKLIHSIFSFFFLFSIGSASFANEENNLLSDFKDIQRTFQMIYSSERELKETWAYQALVTTEIFVGGVFKYPTQGFWGALCNGAYNLTAHNVPGLLCRAADWFLPHHLQASFHQAVSDVFPIFHLCDCVERPLPQALGYMFGFAGLFFVQQVLDHFDLNEQCLKESRGFVYYCFRKAGWLTAENFNEGISSFHHQFPQLINQLGLLPLNCFVGASEIKVPANELDHQCPAPQCFSPFQCHPNPICYHTRLDPRDSEVWKLYSSLLRDHPESPKIKKDKTTAYIISHLNKEYQRAIAEGKVFRVIMGDVHSNSSCTEAKKTVMQFMEGKAEFLNLELGDMPIQEGVQTYQQYKSFAEGYESYMRARETFSKMTETHTDKETYETYKNFVETHENAAIIWSSWNQTYSVIKFALEKNFFIIKAERDLDDSEWYDPQDVLVNPSKYGGYGGFVEKLKRSKSCSDFLFKRDTNMVKTIISLPTSSLSIVGNSHIYGIQRLLKRENKDPFHTIYLRCGEKVHAKGRHSKNYFIDPEAFQYYNIILETYQASPIPAMLTRAKNTECLDTLIHHTYLVITENQSFCVFKESDSSAKKKL